MSAAASSPVVIVGGGATAAAAALALCDAGIVPTVLDVGLVLEPERVALRDRLAGNDAARWREEDIAATRFVPDPTGVLAERRLFGSDVTFREDGFAGLEFDQGVGLRPSYAAGGMTTVWGAGLLAHTPGDTTDWPITPDQLAPHYTRVLEHLPFAGVHDDLAATHPLGRELDGPLVASPTGAAILGRLRRRRRAINAAGVVFGNSRLAVRVGHPAPERGCVYCGHCLDGCPWGHIYNAATTIGQLAERGAIDYRSGIHVVSVHEHAGGAVISARDANGSDTSFEASRVLLAAGALSTTRILQTSGYLPPEVKILDSQTLYLPFAWLGRPAPRQPEPEHALAQAFVVVDGGRMIAKSVHVSLYTYWPENAARAAAQRPLLARAGPAFTAAMRSLVVGIAFLPSELSSALTMTDLGDGRARVAVEPGPHVDAAVRRLNRLLLKALAPSGLVVCNPLVVRAPVGGGYHVGGSIPMRASPSFGESDVEGRPHGAERVHVVDASCFPTIPGGAIALPAMANAHRIASNLAISL